MPTVIHYTPARGVGLGGQRGLHIQGPHVRKAHKDTRMNSHGCGEGPIENTCVQGPEFCPMPLTPAEDL